jgi:polyphosphate kinase 2 (PPK2 family)
VALKQTGSVCDDPHVSRLADVDLTQRLSKSDGERALARAQRRLTALALQSGGQLDGGAVGPGVAILFEGWDAAGKGGAIRRLAAPLDPRHVSVASFAAPTEAERRHHFLWRFGPHVPGRGEIAVFDRTWYGRVLVERVEGFATKAEWKRAYEEIAAFERSLAMEGTVIVKFWLHISDAEQLKRFQAREKDPLKQWKLTDEDWRNREKRPAYERAIETMLERTDTPEAPWQLIAAESKPYARVAVVQAVIEALERGLRDAGQEPVQFDESPG